MPSSIQAFGFMKSLKSLLCFVNYVMKSSSDTESGSSGSATTSENTKAIKEIQKKLNEIVPSLHDSVNLNTIKDLESRMSNLEEKVDQIFKDLESRQINSKGTGG